MMVGLTVASCSDSNDVAVEEGGQASAFEADYIGKAVGNFSADEWYPGGLLGTTDNVTAGCYEDEAPAVTRQGLDAEFNLGETFFERNFNSATAPFNGLGPASLRRSCIDCHPGYGHGKRQMSYKSQFGNGYLLAIYHPVDGQNSNDGPYISEVTGMPQTQASYPFLPPLDEDQIRISWHEVTAMESGLPMEFEDGEKYSLIYPEVYIPTTAFNTKPQPENIAVRLESTIGIMGTGLLDAITEDDRREQYRQEAKYVELNPSMWDKDANDFASTAWYTLADGQKAVKRFTYALTRASLQDGAGANAIWNITNVTRSDRCYHYLDLAGTTYATIASTDPDVQAGFPEYIEKIDPEHTHAEWFTDDVQANIYAYLTSKDLPVEMNDDEYADFMVWHRGLAVPAVRGADDPVVQRGREVFNQIGCAACHRPSWTTGSDQLQDPNRFFTRNSDMPRYPYQTIWPYTDMVQHKLCMENDIRTGWCRTTPLWGRGLHQKITGDTYAARLHDTRARNAVEAILWHGYSTESDAYESTVQFYNLPKEDRNALVKFVDSI